MKTELACIYDYCNECHGCNKGICEVLDEPCTDKDGKVKKTCPFFKTKEEVKEEHKRLEGIKYSDQTRELVDAVVKKFRKEKEEEISNVKIKKLNVNGKRVEFLNEKGTTLFAQTNIIPKDETKQICKKCGATFYTEHELIACPLCRTKM